MFSHKNEPLNKLPKGLSVGQQEKKTQGTVWHFILLACFREKKTLSSGREEVWGSVKMKERGSSRLEMKEKKESMETLTQTWKALWCLKKETLT